MKIEFKHLKDLNDNYLNALKDLEIKAFGEDDGEDSMQWVESVDWHLLVWERDQLVGHVEFSVREILVGGQKLEVGCIGGVCTDPATRGKGYAKTALIEAHKQLFTNLRIDFSVLLTGDEMIPFYEKFNYKTIDSKCVMDQASGKVVYDDILMVLSEKDWPKGDIDFCGLPW